MGKFNEYSQKATPEDADSLMIYDAAAKANKLSPFSGIWNWIVGKLTNAVISNLQTSNKSVIGALNELNSNRAFGTLITSEGLDCNNLGFGIFLLLNPKNGVAEINWHVIISANSNGAQTGFQIAYDLTDGTKAYIRKQASGIWSEWRHFNTSEILSNLTTTNKSSLVDAINEVNGKRFKANSYIISSDSSAKTVNIKWNNTNEHMASFLLIDSNNYVSAYVTGKGSGVVEISKGSGSTPPVLDASSATLKVSLAPWSTALLISFTPVTIS